MELNTFEHVENAETRALLAADPGTLDRKAIIDACDDACTCADIDAEQCEVGDEVVTARIDFAHSALYAAHYGAVAEAQALLREFWLI